MVLNTSFNENEPVVCNPQEALDYFLRSEWMCWCWGNGVVGWQVYRDKPAPQNRDATMDLFFRQ